VTLISALAVFGLLVTVFGFVLAVLRRALAADREVSVTVRVLPWRVEIRVGRGPVPKKPS
jgi:hypothetical protein